MKNKLKFFRIIALAAVMVFTISCTLKSEDENVDFRVAPLDGGKSLEITRYTEEKQVVNIPSRLHGRPVTKIGENVFRGNELIDVTIPNSVTEIGNRAFEGNLLTSISIPNSVTVIGDRAFMGNQLTGITIPNSVTSIGELAFNNNELASVTIGNSVTSIGESAFSANQLTSIVIPNSVTEIGGSAFYNNQITSVNIGSGVHSIGTGAFVGNSLTELTLSPENTALILNGFFLLSSDEKQLILYYGRERNVTIPGSVTEIGGGAFGENQIASVIIPDSVTVIKELAFYQNPLTNIVIGANVEIDRNAFYNDFSAADFTTYYNNQRRRAGTYTLSSGRWIVQ